MLNKSLFSSASDKWNTPINLINELAPFFHWDIDVCASSPNVCENYFNEKENGLLQPWQKLCWMNPPYGRNIHQWVDKARQSPATIVCLLPARTDTKWWQNNVPHASMVVFIRGRLKFGGHKTNAPFPSVFVVFGLLTHAQQTALGKWGWTV